MTLGTFGSTLNDELNRLANNGVYRTKDQLVDEALAAKQWANRENINPYSTDTVGILNEIAGLGLDKRNWLDFNGVCNYIAGTTGLPAAAALRQVYNTTDLLTSQSAYYVDATDASASTQTVTNLGNAGSLLPTTLGSSTAADSNDPKFLDFTGTNYVYLPGVASNRLTVPDSAELDITGDLEVIINCTIETFSVNIPLVIKSATDNLSYVFRIDSSNRPVLVTSPDGTTGSAQTITATAALTTVYTAGNTVWIKATIDVDNGAAGNDVKFFTSTDGVTYTQLGSTVTTAGTTSIFAGTADMWIGQNPTATTQVLTGKVFGVEVFNGIGGTKVLDVDTSVITAGSATSFTAVTGQTVTINRSTSGRKTVAVTQPTWLFGTDDYMEVNNRYMASGTYLYLPGVASNWASTPDSAALDITGDIDIRCKVALDDWTPSTSTILVAKWSTGSAKSYGLGVSTTTGTLSFSWTPDGTAVTTVVSTVAPTVADGATLWVRVTMDVDNGASGNDITFYTSTDGTNWTQLGTTVTTAGVASIHNSNAVLGIGAQLSGSNSFVKGKFFRAQVLDGIDGTTVFDADFETSITSLTQADFTESSANSATVTINRSGSAYRSAGITAAGYLYPGATNTFSASATDFLNFGAADSFTVVAAVRKFATFLTFRGIVSKTRGVNDGYYLTNNTADTNLAFVIDSAGQTGGAGLTSGLPNGELNVISGVVNRANQTSTTYSNSLTPAIDTDISNVGTLTYNDTTLQIARRGGGSVYADIEVYATAVFRSVLTPAQIRQITNYFANREVYL